MPRHVSEATYELVYQAIEEAGAYNTERERRRIDRAVVKILRQLNLNPPKGY